MTEQNWWTSYLINPQALRGLYDEEPSLDGFRLLGLSLEERGPNCLIRGEMPRFPDHPRPAWDFDAHRLLLRFSLGAIDKFNVRGQVVGGPLNLTIRRADDGFGIVVAGQGDQFTFSVQGMGLQMLGMTAYG